jgi:hypothetical protein
MSASTDESRLHTTRAAKPPQHNARAQALSANRWALQSASRVEGTTHAPRPQRSDQPSVDRLGPKQLTTQQTLTPSSKFRSKRTAQYKNAYDRVFKIWRFVTRSE